MAKPRETTRAELIEAVGPLIQSLARELNDDAPTSTITRVVNILEQNGIPARHSPHLIYQARERLRQRHNVKRKAPYLIVLLEELARTWTPPPPRIGNQNARKHGWWSKTRPLTNEELEQTVHELLTTEQFDKLRELARAVRYVRGDRLLAQNIRRLARLAERRAVLRASRLYPRVRTALGEQANDIVGEWEEP